MWDDERDPVRLIHLARARGLPESAFLLTSAACCRLAEHLIPHDSWRRVLPQAEAFAEGALGELCWGDLPDWHAQTASVPRNVAFALYSLYPYSFGSPPSLVGASHHALAVPGYVARALAGAAAGPTGANLSPNDPWHARWRAAYHAALARQADLARCVFGPPERVAFAGRWRSRDVGDLAAAARRTGDPSLYLPLRDALIEAGCDDASLLDHCHGGGHARGCWALVLVAGAA